MNKRKLLLKIIIFAVVLSLNLNLFVALADLDDSSDAASDTTASDTATDSGDEEVEAVEIDPPEDIKYELVASNRNLEMYFDKELCYLKVVDKKTDNEWVSTPSYLNEIGGKAAKKLIGSLVTYTFFDSQDNTSTVGVKSSSISSKNFVVKEITDGIKVTFTTTQGIVIPVELVLKDDCLSASIPVSEIEEKNDDNRLASISLLPYFGAGSTEDEGYALIPDGSGALVEFNQATSGIYSYSQRIYGRDSALELKTKSSATQEARLPVFGINKNGDGMLAIVTESPAAATVNAGVVGQSNVMNNAYFSYVHRVYDTVYAREGTWNQRPARILDETDQHPERFEVCYYFLDDDASDYVGMANRYQQYLIDELGVAKQTEEDESKLYIEFLNGIKRLKNILGFPVNSDIPITSFEDVANITNELNAAGVKDIATILTNWTDNTTDFKIPYNFKPESSLGGKKGLTSMLESLNAIGAECFPDVNMVQIRENSLSYRAKRDVVQTLGNAPVTVFSFKMSTYDQDKTYDAIYMLNYSLLPGLAEKIVKNSSSYNFTGFSAATLGQNMYSSLGTKKSLGRSDAENYAKEALGIMTQDSKMLFSNPNAYVLQYASDITDIPVRSSQYLLATQDVPFYQIALHGLLNYSTESLNAFYDQQYYTLKAIETGSSVKYTLGAQNFDKLQYTEYEYYNYIDYSLWKDTIIDTYNTVSAVNRKVSTAKIIGHEYLTDDVVMTSYDNGIQVVVNYSDTDYSADGIKCSANNYSVMGD